VRAPLVLLLAALGPAGCQNVLGLAPVTVAPDADPAGPIAYYKMDGFGPSNTTAPDETGHHEGFFTGGMPAIDPAGRLGAAYTFDGQGELLHIPYAAELQSPELTVSIWIEIDAAGASAACFINQLLPDGGDTWQICLDAGYLDFLAEATPTAQFVAASPIDLGAWRNVALVLHDGEMIGYYDGLRVGSIPVAPVYQANEDIVLGGDIDQTVIAPLTGSLDELRIFGRAMSDAEIAALASR
jgi:hypothetical protein